MARRRIKKARITHISLVPKGANQLPVIFKADDSTVQFSMLAKDMTEEGEIHAIVYAPEHRDSQGDVASASVIKEAAHEAQREGIKIDMRHDGVTVDKQSAFIAESFIVQKGDPRFNGITTHDGETIDPAGSWGVVIKVDDEGLRKKYRNGEWQGVSMGGTALVESEKSDDNLADRIIDLMSKALNNEPTGDIDMKPEELTAVLKENNSTLVKDLTAGIVAGVGALLKPKADDTDTETVTKEDKKPKKRERPAPIFKGSILNPDDLEAHQRRLALHEISKSVDFSDMDEVNELVEKIAEFEQNFGELTDEEKRMVNGGPATRRKVGSNTGSVRKSDGNGDDGDGPLAFIDGIDKEDDGDPGAGAAMAKWANEQRGYGT